jgi:hypothetical protein
MQITKLTIVLGIAGLLGSSSAVQAQTDTYIFTAAPDYTTAFNGSTITIDGTGAGVTAFSFYDVDFSPVPYSGPGLVVDNNILSYNTTGWTGEFTIIPDPSFIFGATGTSMDGGFTSPPLLVDPPGTWANINVSAPDASSTFPLLMGVLAALAGVHFYQRPRVVAVAADKR